MVWPENWPTVLVFLALQTQWRRDVPPMGGALIWQGLDYPATETVIRLQGHRGRAAREIFSGIQIMEAAALKLLNQTK